MSVDPSPKPRLRHTHKQPPKLHLPRSWRVAASVVGGVVFVVVLFVFVFPTRTYLTQRHDLSLAAERLRVLNAQNAQLTKEAQRLQTPAEIERLAREQYHMVQPGEKAYVILPAPAPTTTVAPPPSHVAAAHQTDGWYHVLTSWLP